MVTVHREAGFRITIYLEDHEPAHVHVYGDGEMKINLMSPNGRPQVVDFTKMRAGDVRKALRIVTDQQAMLLEKWKEFHG
jgi:Domain of unknown function (DUF4160)